MGKIANAARARLNEGGLALGMGVRAVRGVEVARVMKTAGYDFLFIDLEHGATSVETAYGICVADTSPARTPSPTRWPTTTARWPGRRP